MLFKKRDASLQIFNYDRCVFDNSVSFLKFAVLS